jgi:exosome complex component RRP41
LKEFPNTVVDVQVYIPQADASTRVAGINAAALALAHAGLPMKDLVSAVSIGKLDKDLVVDVDKEEEDFREGEGATDFPMAKVSNSDQFTLLQLDGKIPPEMIKKALEMGTKACAEVYKVQKKALKDVLKL